MIIVLFLYHHEIPELKMEDTTRNKIMSAAFSSLPTPVFCKMNVSKICSTLFYFVVAILSSQLDLAVAADPTPASGLAVGASSTTTKGPSTTSPAAVALNSTSPTDKDKDVKYISDMVYDKSMLRRSFFVLIGFTCLAVIFFAVRWYRSRGKRKSKKYGVLATRSSDMELRPLDQEDDEEDMTVFDVNSK